ncbi:MAG: hypothetical protein FWG18_03615 [Alphaproteobacteria bacterium]|nr:hypothetical protein [Alphaproteobacteria bacterium]
MNDAVKTTLINYFQGNNIRPDILERTFISGVSCATAVAYAIKNFNSDDWVAGLRNFKRTIEHHRSFGYAAYETRADKVQ